VVLISPSSCAEVRILERLGARRQPATQAVTVLKRGRSSYSRQLPANTRRKQRICGDPSILGANCIKPTAASCTTRHLPPHIHSSEPHLSTSMLGGLYGSLPKAKEAEGGAGGAGGTGGAGGSLGSLQPLSTCGECGEAAHCAQPLARHVDAVVEVEVSEARQVAQRQHFLVRHGVAIFEVESGERRLLRSSTHSPTSTTGLGSASTSA
jgi:hypothetical protein